MRDSCKAIHQQPVQYPKISSFSNRSMMLSCHFVGQRGRSYRFLRAFVVKTSPKLPRKYMDLVVNRTVVITMLPKVTQFHEDTDVTFFQPRHQKVTPRWPRSPHQSADRYARTTAISSVVFKTNIPIIATSKKRFPSWKARTSSVVLISGAVKGSCDETK